MEKGDAASIAAVISCLNDAAWTVRQAACNALPHLVEKGGAASIVAVTFCPKFENADVKYCLGYRGRLHGKRGL
jgi:hypothetical protein